MSQTEGGTAVTCAVVAGLPTARVRHIFWLFCVNVNILAVQGNLVQTHVG
jgi:hypothetical protein